MNGHNRRGRGRGKARGGSSWRGGTRGRGRGRGRGIQFAHNVAKFGGNIEAHRTAGREGITCMAVWVERQQIFTAGKDGVVNIFDFQGNFVSSKQENGEITAMCCANGWLFIGIRAPGPGIGAQAMCVTRGINMSQPEVDFEFSPNDAGQPPPDLSQPVNSICVLDDMVLVASSDIRAWKFDGSKWACCGVLSGAPGPFTRILPFNGRLFSCTAHGFIHIWDLPGSGGLITSLQAHEQQITDIVSWETDAQHPTTPNALVVLTCSTDARTKVWQIAPLQEVPNAPGAQVINPQPIFDYPADSYAKLKPVSSLSTAKHKGKDVLVIGFQDGSIQLVELPSFLDLGFLSGHKRGSPTTALSVNGELILAGSADGNLNCFGFLAN